MGWGHDASGDFQWSIRSRGTPSFFTGPESDLYRIGKYETCTNACNLKDHMYHMYLCAICSHTKIGHLS